MSEREGELALEEDLSQAEAIINRYKDEKGSLTHILQELQEHYYYLPKEALMRVSQGLGIPLSQVYSLATFYKAFSLQPRGKHLVSVCMGTACHVKGAPLLLDKVARELEVEVGGTTADRQFTVEGVRCLGCCSLAPVLRVGDEVFGYVTQSKVPPLLKRFGGDKDKG